MESGPHVPYPNAELAGRTAVLRHYISGEPVALVWSTDYLQVRTVDRHGKLYQFRAYRDNTVFFERW